MTSTEQQPSSQQPSSSLQLQPPSPTPSTITFEKWWADHGSSVTKLGNWVRGLFGYVPRQSYHEGFGALFQYAITKASSSEEKDGILTELINVGKSLDRVRKALDEWSETQKKESKLGQEIKILLHATDVWAQSIKSGDPPRELRPSLKRKRDRIRALVRAEIGKTEELRFKYETLTKSRSRPPSPSSQWPKYSEGALQGMRPTMEDKHHVGYLTKHKDILMAGVFDGHGGTGAAQYCAESLHNTIDRHLGDSMPSLAKAESVLKDAFIETDKSYINQNPKETSGSTVVVTLLDTKTLELVIANAGDAECLISVAGTAYTMSKRHKPEDQEEKARIKEAGHAVVFGRIDASLAVSRAIGDAEFKTGSQEEKDTPPERWACTPVPSVNRIKLGDDAEFILLACDGLFDVCKAQEIVDWVRDRFQKKVLTGGSRTDTSKFTAAPASTTSSSSSSSSSSSITSTTSTTAPSASTPASTPASDHVPMDLDDTEEKGHKGPSIIKLGDGKTIHNLAETLCQHAVSKRSQDNVSCLIIFLGRE